MWTPAFFEGEIGPARTQDRRSQTRGRRKEASNEGERARLNVRAGTLRRNDLGSRDYRQGLNLPASWRRIAKPGDGHIERQA